MRKKCEVVVSRLTRTFTCAGFSDVLLIQGDMNVKAKRFSLESFDLPEILLTKRRNRSAKEQGRLSASRPRSKCFSGFAGGLVHLDNKNGQKDNRRSPQGDSFWGPLLLFQPCGRELGANAKFSLAQVIRMGWGQGCSPRRKGRSLTIILRSQSESI